MKFKPIQYTLFILLLLVLANAVYYQDNVSMYVKHGTALACLSLAWYHISLLKRKRKSILTTILEALGHASK